MVLTAGVEATADLDAKAADDFIQLRVFRSETLAEFAGEAARSGDAELAGIGAGARRDVNDRFGDRSCESGFLQFGVDSGKIGIAHPSEDEVLFHRAADGFLHVLAGDIREFAHLRGGEIAEWKREGDGRVAFLTLLVDVDAMPLIELFGARGFDLKKRRRLERFFLMRVGFLKITGPARIVL